MSKTIIFGPWFGEFSYEVCLWAPRLRKICRHEYQDYHKIAVGYAGREILYADFVDEYIPFDEETLSKIGYPDCQHSRDTNTSERYFVDPAVESFVSKISESYPQTSRFNVHEQGVSHTSFYNVGRFAEFIRLSAREEFIEEVQKYIEDTFGDNDCPTIAVLARYKERAQELTPKLARDLDNLKQETWEKFLQNIIDKFNANIVFIHIPIKFSTAGSIDFYESKFYNDNKEKIGQITFEGKDSLEKQLALLQCCMCSIYGATGAQFFVFQTDTPMFGIQRRGQHNRLALPWCHDLTNNFEKIEIIYQENTDGYYNLSADYIFDKFKTFYNKVKK